MKRNDIELSANDELYNQIKQIIEDLYFEENPNRYWFLLGQLNFQFFGIHEDLLKIINKVSEEE